MADVAQNLITFLLTSASISTAVGATRISQTHVPQEFTGDLIWFNRSNVQMNDCLDAVPGEDAHEEYFDLECVSATEEGAQALTELVKDKLHSHAGTFGTQTVQAVFCEDHADDYEPRSIDLDSGLFVGALNVQIVPRT